MNPVRGGLILGLRCYRALVSPILTTLFGPLGFGCRFTPTCSQYAMDAIQTHGSVKGSWLAARRLCRCHPWGGCGPDPVPPASVQRRARALTLRSETGQEPCQHGS